MDLPESNQPPQDRVVLQVIFTADGQMRILGSILTDKIAAYGVLEVVKDMISDMHKPKLVKPNGHGMLDFVRGKK